jgi:hypothetical protein
MSPPPLVSNAIHFPSEDQEGFPAIERVSRFGAQPSALTT